MLLSNPIAPAKQAGEGQLQICQEQPTALCSCSTYSEQRGGFWILTQQRLPGEFDGKDEEVFQGPRKVSCCLCLSKDLFMVHGHWVWWG